MDVFVWFHLGVLLGLVGFSANLVLNLRVFRRPRLARPGDSGVPLVSILIPARNEEHRLPACLDSLLAQDYPHLEWRVLDDHSTDGTGAVVRERMARQPGLTLMQGASLPEGWTGKSWACWQLAGSAQGQLLLFTDADTVHAPNSVSAAVAELEGRRADLLSLWPHQITGSWSEVLILPFVHVLILLFLPQWLPFRHRSLGVANGQFVLFRRSAYEAIGGHRTVRAHLVEDVALGREIKTRGFGLVNGDGTGLIRCRMYTCFAEVWEGFTKNLRAGFEDSVGSFVALGIIQVIFLLAPFAWLFVGLVWGASWLPVVVAQVVVILALRGFLAFRYRHPWVSVPLHPAGQFLALCIAMNSWIQSARGSVTWKGRTYRP
ncbi:MAG: glycosyltransferase [Verrucomicrobiia bacterium]